MDRIDKYKRLEEDQIQGKGKAKMFLEKRDPQGGGYHNDQSRRDFPSHATSMGIQLVNSLFKESVYQIPEKIKKKSHFSSGPIRWAGIHPRGIKVFTAIIIGTEDTP